jgi:hypothetical protein
MQQSSVLTWTGRVLSALPVLALLMSGAMKISQSPEVLEGFAKYGYEPGVVAPIGVFEVVCAVVYAIPRTAVLGAILAAGYLGGAAATHVAAGEPFLAPVILAMIAWAGIGLRDPRLRALLPLSRS